ncbi:MAG TPA: MFS transporter [Xanthobacteraceae bacterium]|nr:MFS transporter [Xanthobacteraceae bacterium]
MPLSSSSDPSGATLVRLLALLWMGGCALRLPILAIPPVIPFIHGDLHLSETEIGLLNGLPLGLFAAAAVPGSLLVARLGVRTTMLLGLVLTALASAARGAAVDALTLYAATALTGFGVAVMQPALPAQVRAWVPTRVPLGTAVYTNGMVMGATLGPVLTSLLVLPWVGGSWRLDLVVWSAVIGVIAVVFLLANPPVAAETGKADTPAMHRWWPDWTDPLIWLLGLGFGSTNALYFGANAFLPDFLVAQGRGDLVGWALACLNGSQVLTSVTLLFIANRVHRRTWPYLMFGPISLAALAAMVWGGGAWIVAAAFVLGVAAAVPFVLILALPPTLSAPGDVHRTAAGMFTISYAFAVVIPVISGALWDLAGIAWTAFLPLAACSVIITTLGARLSRQRAARA